MIASDNWGDVHLDPKAANEIEKAAEQAHPLETGGALLGYRRDGAVLVTSALVIDDPSATPSSYTGRSRLIQQALDLVLPTLAEGTGYVGPWHTHPARAGHSRRDRRALRRIADQYTNPIISLVAVRASSGYQLEVVVAQNKRRTRTGRFRIETIPSFPTEN